MSFSLCCTWIVHSREQKRTQRIIYLEIIGKFSWRVASIWLIDYFLFIEPTFSLLRPKKK